MTQRLQAGDGAAGFTPEQVEFMKRKESGAMPSRKPCPDCQGAGMKDCGPCKGTGMNSSDSSQEEMIARSPGVNPFAFNPDQQCWLCR
jgi:hypothetical protein